MKGSDGQANFNTTDRTAEAMAATRAAAAVQRSQNMPSRKITQMPGVKKPVNSWMYWNAWSKLPSSGLAVTIAMTSATTAVQPPDQHQVLLRCLRTQRAGRHPS